MWDMFPNVSRMSRVKHDLLHQQNIHNWSRLTCASNDVFWRHMIRLCTQRWHPWILRLLEQIWPDSIPYAPVTHTDDSVDQSWVWVHWFNHWHGIYEQQRMRLKFGQRCFSYAAPAAWNTLPSLQQLTNTDSFKRQLKTVLFERAFA